MARKKQQSKSKGNRGGNAQFERGCGLSCCLLYFGLGALSLLAGALLSIGLFTTYLIRHWPQLERSLEGMPIEGLLAAVNIPLAALLALGIVILMQVGAIWRGRRWGFIGLSLLVVSDIVWSLIDVRSFDDLVNVWPNIGTLLLSYAALCWFIRTRWAQMR